jgi:hypothetical protein
MTGGKRMKRPIGNGSDLSRTGFVCINTEASTYEAQMRTIRYRALFLPSALSVYCRISGGNINARRKKKPRKMLWLGPGRTGSLCIIVYTMLITSRCRPSTEPYLLPFTPSYYYAIFSGMNVRRKKKAEARA